LIESAVRRPCVRRHALAMRAHRKGTIQQAAFQTLLIPLDATCSSLRRVRSPELAGCLDWIDPASFHRAASAHAMHQPVMNSTERDRELVARCAPERARLREAQAMRVRARRSREPLFSLAAGLSRSRPPLAPISSRSATTVAGISIHPPSPRFTPKPRPSRQAKIELSE
jgi:hypothetical protein